MKNKENAVCLAKFIIVFSAIGAIITLSCFVHGYCSKEDTFWPAYLGVWIAIANAILLYATLTSQNRAFKKERYETTFYKMLDAHQSLTNHICMKAKESDPFPICGKLFFDFASREMMRIQECLNSDSYLGKFNQNDVNEEGIAIEDEYERKLSTNDIDAESWRRKEEIRIQQKHQIQLTNKEYDISESDWKDYKEAKPTANMEYLFFCHKWYGVYENYIRSVIHILSFIDEYDDGDSRENTLYLDYFRATLSMNELELIKRHSLVDKKLNEILKNINNDKTKEIQS